MTVAAGSVCGVIASPLPTVIGNVPMELSNFVASVHVTVIVDVPVVAGVPESVAPEKLSQLAPVTLHV